jgi:hypothetical protein
MNDFALPTIQVDFRGDGNTFTMFLHAATPTYAAVSLLPDGRDRQAVAWTLVVEADHHYRPKEGPCQWP